MNPDYTSAMNLIKKKSQKIRQKINNQFFDNEMKEIDYCI